MQGSLSRECCFYLEVQSCEELKYNMSKKIVEAKILINTEIPPSNTLSYYICVTDIQIYTRIDATTQTTGNKLI